MVVKNRLFPYLAYLSDQCLTLNFEADRAAKICSGIALRDSALWLIFGGPIDRREFLPYQEPR